MTEPSDHPEPEADETTRAEDEPSELVPVVDERAAAEQYLDGPGLRPPIDGPDPAELEATWNDDARGGLSDVLEDLDGRRLGLAISGGGALGSFEAGALRFLYDHLHIDPVAITGNSAGALNAAKLAHGDRDRVRAVDEVERLWRAMRLNRDMWEPEPWLEKIMASAQWAAAIRAQPDGSGQSAGAMRVAVRVINSFVRRPEETDGTIDAIRDALKAQSLLSLQPVAELVAQQLDVEQVASSGIELRVGAVALESGELRYIGQDGQLHDRRGTPLPLPKVSLADGILASASIPVAFPPVLLGDEHYVDGGAREILPLQLLVEGLGVERAIAVSAGSTAIAPSASYANRGLFDIMRRVTAEIAPNETLRKELSPPGGWKEHVRLVIPDIEVHDTMTIDPALIAVSFDYGWMRTADLLLGLGPEEQRLTEEIAETRIALRRLAGPLPVLLGRDLVDVEPPPGITETGWVDGKDTLTSRLREQVGVRRERGGPLPASLAAWLDA
ncbi:MAG: patatin-like phospholipase family protein [Actinobacteria bacterium]|nr:patatin-like phospholipase family protein [Actinomycetota bacterium]